MYRDCYTMKLAYPIADYIPLSGAGIGRQYTRQRGRTKRAATLLTSKAVSPIVAAPCEVQILTRSNNIRV